LKRRGVKLREDVDRDEGNNGGRSGRIHEHDQEERCNAFFVHNINLSESGIGDDPFVYCFIIDSFY
jgi:hypothetical protein